MWRRIVLSTALVLAFGGHVKSETVYSLIQRGQIEEARDSLSRQVSAGVRDGDALCLQGMLESDGAAAARLMEAALAAARPSQYWEETTYRLAQYYLLQRNYSRVTELVTNYMTHPDKATFRPQMMRLSILAAERTKQHESALRQCDRYLIENNTGDVQQWGLIDKARILEANGKTIGAAETIKQLSRSRKGPGVSQALYLLGMQAVTKRHADDAILYYNMLREAYPSAVGLDQLTAGLGDMPDEPRGGNQAEQVTDTYYSVKVGVFSEAENALRQADKFKAAGQKVDVEAKKISGRDYRVVYVGRFRDYEEAVRFKLQLEASHHETFQVVAR
jgi:tetratricopeptide (TPR) repeat protein